MASQSSLFQCSACYALFPSMDEFNGHPCVEIVQRQDNSVSNVATYECTHCFLQFPSIEGLNAHTCNTQEQETNNVTTKRYKHWSSGMTKCFLSLYVDYKDEMDSIDSTKKRVSNFLLFCKYLLI